MVTPLVTPSEKKVIIAIIINKIVTVGGRPEERIKF